MTASVIVGIDGSDVARAALVFAAQEARRRAARLIVAHAGDIATPAEIEDEVRPFGEIVCGEAITTVAAVDPLVDCHVVHRDADPADLLIELSGDAELLVVGTHRAGRLRGWVLGSVSQLVAAHARCPVVTVSGPPEHDGAPIVLGASSSPGGVAALRFACEEARLRHVAVRAVRAVTSEDWMLSVPDYALAVRSDDLRHVANTELHKVLAIAEELDPDVSISGELSLVNPFTALLDVARDASLLVVGCRRGQNSSLPHLGPVASWLLHQSACPLAVVGHSESA
jgi:nucleotide-binding universal stress UspA family protein